MRKECCNTSSLPTKDSSSLRTSSILVCRIASRTRQGIPQAGIVTGILESIKSSHPDFYGPLMQNITLFGGSSLFPGFRDRLDREILPNCDQFVRPSINHLTDSDVVFKALHHITNSDTFELSCLTRSIYNDLGCSQTAANF